MSRFSFQWLCVALLAACFCRLAAGACTYTLVASNRLAGWPGNVGAFMRRTPADCFAACRANPQCKSFGTMDYASAGTYCMLYDRPADSLSTSRVVSSSIYALTDCASASGAAAEREPLAAVQAPAPAVVTGDSRLSLTSTAVMIVAVVVVAAIAVFVAVVYWRRRRTVVAAMMPKVNADDCITHRGDLPPLLYTPRSLNPLYRPDTELRVDLPTVA
eukprot:TRINITY_DN6945_c0_g1_i1.p1 TRINITY_DN6945_c0_g1~~TRINITY_DN6945_c0_g1_i1.p1  ORF type:complete len:247 (-),score=56.01 TRINITY_DN6945_c0_g1_i1:592-1242(-)